jgi:hypothetical protein
LGSVESEPLRERGTSVVRVVARRRVGERSVFMLRTALVRIWSRVGGSSRGADWMRWRMTRGGDVVAMLTDGILSVLDEGDMLGGSLESMLVK